MFLRRRKTGLEESFKALEDADQNLQRVRSRDKEVREVAESLREIRKRNHFAEQLQEIFGVKPTHNLGGGHAK